MNGLLVGIYIVGMELVCAFLFKSDLAVDRVECHLNDVVCGELGGFVFAVKLHLVAVPGVSVRTDQVVAVVCVGIAEVEVYSLYAVQVGHSYSDPRSQFFYLHLPFLEAASH